MPKRPVSVTLDGKRRSLSEALDEIVSAARVSADGRTIRSVVGTIDISTDDPNLERAGEFIRGELAASLGRPLILHEEQARYSPPSRAPRGATKRSARRRA
jgi:hypothetical protein